MENAHENVKSDESFHSMSSYEEGSPRDQKPSLSYARDLINALGNESLSNEKKEKIMNMITELPVKDDVRLAEGLITCPDPRKLDIFSLCRMLLSEHSQDSQYLRTFLHFFGQVLKSVFSQPDLSDVFKRLVEKQSNCFELYQTLIQILKEEANHDKVFKNQVAKIIFYVTTKEKVREMFSEGRSYQFSSFVTNLHKMNVKYGSMTCYKFIHFWYKIKHDLVHTSNGEKQDLIFCDWLIKALSKFPNQTDCIYGIYFITDKMPMTTLLTVFEGNGLEKILQASLDWFQKRGNDEMELLLLKVKLSKNEGNFLSGRIQREAILKDRRPPPQGRFQNQNGRRFPAQNNQNPDLIPLDYEPVRTASYKGVLRSINDLLEDGKNPYVANDNVHHDKRIEMKEEECQVVDFHYGRIFHKKSIIQQGIELRTLPDANHKYKVAGEICDLLNKEEALGGVLLFGITGLDEDMQVVRGLKMTRKDRDEFRIGLDNLLTGLIEPTPNYRRFEQPVFNPVLNHPGDQGCDEATTHFIVRFDVKPPCDEDKSLKFRLKSTIFKKKNKA